jgi:hypothetical protein
LKLGKIKTRYLKSIHFTDPRNCLVLAHIHKVRQEKTAAVARLSMGKGIITSSDLMGAVVGKQISDLVNIMKSAGIHTQQNQNGEIRGQIMIGS